MLRAYHIKCEATTALILLLDRQLLLILYAAPLDKGHLFQAKYVPFKAVLEGDPWKSEESYSLDEVIYRSALPVHADLSFEMI